MKQRREDQDAFFAEAVAMPVLRLPYIRCVELGHGQPPCAHTLGHSFKITDTIDNHVSELGASGSSDEIAESQRFDPASYLANPASSDFRDIYASNAPDLGESSTIENHDDLPTMTLNEPQYANLPQEKMSVHGIGLPLGYENSRNDLDSNMHIDDMPSAAVFVELSKLSSWQSSVNARQEPTNFDALGFAESPFPLVESQDGFRSATASWAPPDPSQRTTDRFDRHRELHQPDKQRDSRSNFMSAVMLACMYGAAKRNGPQALCMEQAFSAFRRLCVTNSPFTLSSAITMLGWMMVHVEGSLTDEIMWSIHRVASEVFCSNDPICLLLKWMYLAAANKLKSSPINSTQLRRIWHVFKGLDKSSLHHSIVARYCLAFHLIKVDRAEDAGALADAVSHLQELEVIARNVLGVTDLMTINIVSTLSRARSRMNDYLGALDAINRGLHAVPLDGNHPLGANHPHILEMIVRKAVLCWRLGRSDEAERLYSIAYRGRIATLGPEHRSTNKAHHSLVTVLKERERWESKKDEVQRLVVDPQVAVTEYESWWRRVVEANRNSGRFRDSSEETN